MSDSPVKITLSGDRDLVAAMQDFREYLPKTALRQALRKAAELLTQFIALVAPKLTGRLARNIAVKVKQTAKTTRAGVIVNTRGKAGDENNAFYWRFLEEGFHTRSGEFKKYPFIHGVFDQKNREAAQLVLDSIEAALERAEKKAARKASLVSNF